MFQCLFVVKQAPILRTVIVSGQLQKRKPSSRPLNVPTELPLY